MSHELRNAAVDKMVESIFNLDEVTNGNMNVNYVYEFMKLKPIELISLVLFNEDGEDVYGEDDAEGANELDEYGAFVISFEVVIKDGKCLLFIVTNHGKSMVDLDASLYDMRDPSDVAICIRCLIAIEH